MSSIRNIDQVIEELDNIIATSIEDRSTMGYFAALYRKVTLKVKEGIEANNFEDGTRMEQLDVVFAQRYITAFHAYKKGDPVTASWKIAFDSAKNNRLIVLQHLLLGMNAHINLDLGIAAANTMKGKPIEGLHADFLRINEILSDLVHEVQEDLSKIWPLLKILVRLFGKLDEFVTDFSMKMARDGAWKFAMELANCNQKEEAEFIKNRDEKINLKTDLILKQGFFISLMLGIIRWGERGSIRAKIQELRD